MGKTDKKESNIFDWNDKKVKEFLLKGSSYCTLKLPEYFKFDGILKYYDKILKNKTYTDFYKNNPSRKPDDYDNVSFSLFSEKGTQTQWRCFKLINPFLYVALVQEIVGNWSTIANKYCELKSNDKIICCSLVTKDTHTLKSQILKWYTTFELRTIELSNKFECMAIADISNCYSSIYTHSIGWAIDGKTQSKACRKSGNGKRSNLLGYKIDKLVQLMQYGQTNGIPEGNECSNLLAEIILAYIDYELSNKIDISNINKDYIILRYRDDYRIFCHTKEDSMKILNLLTKSLDEIGLKINDKKTTITDNILKDAIKREKEYGLIQNVGRLGSKDLSLLDSIRLIWVTSEQFPNSGIIKKLLSIFYKKKVKNIRKNKNYKSDKQNIIHVISYLIDIMYKSSNCYPQVIAIISILLKHIPNEIDVIINDIFSKFKKKPYTEYFEIWFQRLCIGYKVDDRREYESEICRFVLEAKSSIWNFDWFNGKSYKYDFIDRKLIKKVREAINYERVNEFSKYCE